MLLDKLVIVLISPLGTSLVVAILSFLLLWLGRRNLGATLGVFAFVWLLVWSLPPVAESLARSVESPYQPAVLDDIPQSSAIVVLGGGMSASLFAEKTGQPLELGEATDRVWFAARLFHAGKAPMIIMTGGKTTEADPFSESRAMGILSRDLGVPESILVLESSSRNTRENARFSASLLHQHGVNDIILVTSAAHMARAVHHFEEEGLRVFPAPTDYAEGRMRRKPCCLPDAEALVVSGQLIKEVVGQLVWH